MDSDKVILKKYDMFHSVKRVIDDTGYSWSRVIKSLSSQGVIINKTHKKILQAYESKMPLNEIADELHLNPKTVQAYLPRVRPIYGTSTTCNARNLRNYWERKRQKAKAESNTNNPK